MSLLPRYLLVLGVFLALAALTVWGYIITRSYDRTQLTPLTPSVAQTRPAGATQPANTQPAGTTNPAPQAPVAQGPRIVSLAPAISQMLVDLHMDGDIVGKAEHDTSAPAKIRVVGNFQDINVEALLATKPTMVLMMTGASGVPKVLSDLAEKKRFTLYAYPYPPTIDDTLDILHDPQADQYKAASQPDLATVLGDPAAAIRLRRTLDMQIQAVRDVVRDLPKPRVLAAFSTSPVMASGSKTVNDELLQIAGAINPAASAKIMAPSYDREKLTALAPDIILLLSPGAPALGPIESDARLESLRGVNIPAVTNKRIVLLNDPLILLPSTNLAHTAAAFAKAIHPDKAKQIDDAVAAAAKAARDLPLNTDEIPETVISGADSAPASTGAAGMPPQTQPATQPAATQP
jgi:ABC-type Fe3+-hydroxamate transport system substrate-binding protein